MVLDIYFQENCLVEMNNFPSFFKTTRSGIHTNTIFLFNYLMKITSIELKIQDQFNYVINTHNTRI